MKVWKIVSGVISIAISLFVVFQSRFAALYDILTGNGQASGIAGMLVATMLVSGGVVSIVTRNGNRAGDIAMTFLYSLGAFIGFLGAGSYTDLYIWAGWCVLCVIFAIVDCILLSRSYEDEDVSVPVRTTTSVRTGPTTFQDVILETDPQRRNAAIDALPERQAKSYLKQALNVLVPRQAAGSDDDGLVKTLVAILVVLGVFIIGVIVVGIVTSTPVNRETVSSAPPVSSNDIQESEPAQETPEQSQAVEPTASPAGTLGDYYVEIRDACITTDYEGNPAIAVSYTWTNNSEETTHASLELTRRAFQDGIQLDLATISVDSPIYANDSEWRDIRPGTTLDAQCAFKINNATSPIEIEISESDFFSNDLILAVFDPTSLEVVE